MSRVVIEVETSRDVFEPLDLARDAEVTLNFKSNLLSRLSDITRGVSQTVKIPRTVRNDRILDLAGVPQYDSVMTHVKRRCHCYIDGMNMIGEAWLYVLRASADGYEAAVTFGLMSGLSGWIDAGKTLRDLDPRPRNSSGAFVTGTDGASWDEDAAVRYWAGGVGYSAYKPASRWSVYYGKYDCGVTLDDTTRQWCNLHPWVSLREIYERVVRENGLSFTMPQNVLDDMESVGLLLTTNNNKTVQGAREYLTFETNPERYQDTFHLTVGNNDFFANRKFIHKGAGDVALIPGYTHVLVSGTDDTTGLPATHPYHTYNDFVGAVDVNACPMYVTGVSGEIIPERVYVNRRPALRYRLPDTMHFDYAKEGFPLAGFEIDFKKVPSIEREYEFSYFAGQGFVVSDIYGIDPMPIEYDYNIETGSYPVVNRYKLVANLPNLKQLDFIIALCQHYGLFAVTGGGDAVKFVPFETIDDNRNAAVDWSSKLVEADTRHGVNALKTEYTMPMFKARRNWMRYKVDDKEEVRNDDAEYIAVNDTTLEGDDDVVTFPWSASSGDRVTQYALNEEGDGVDFAECNTRLMRIEGIAEDTQEDYLSQKSLTFTAGMTAASIVSARYAALAAAAAKPRVITERLLLNEDDIMGLDFTVPVYMRKYGRYFAVISVRWSSNTKTSEVKLLLL